MPLIAHRAATGEEMEAFSIAPQAWNTMRGEPLGTYVMPGSRWPAVSKRSIRGTQFFAHAPGYPGVKPEPESEHHLRAKIAIAKALRTAGYAETWVERSGASPDGEPWQADVLCEAAGRTIAFEVQLAQQTLEEYEQRTARYGRSGVKCVWLVRAPKHYRALSRALYYRYYPPKATGIRPSHKDLPAFRFDIGDPKIVDLDAMRVMVIAENGPLHLPIPDFVVGVAAGWLVFSAQEWRWRSPDAA